MSREVSFLFSASKRGTHLLPPSAPGHAIQRPVLFREGLGKASWTVHATSGSLCTAESHKRADSVAVGQDLMSIASNAVNVGLKMPSWVFGKSPGSVKISAGIFLLEQPRQT